MMRVHWQTSTLALPSVLDRLLDDAPNQPRQGIALYFDLSDFKAALARDLEAPRTIRNCCASTCNAP
jgi:hypothetical protein